MRFVVMCLALAACTPDIASGAYLCGPDSACPEGQTCNGVKDENAGLEADTCVLESLARPFACTPDSNSEPDNTMAEARAIPLTQCVSPMFINNSCMLADDSADWITFVPPSVCTAVAVQVRLTFPVAYEVLAFELWDVNANMKIGEDTECTQGADTGAVRRCLDMTLVPGTQYGVKVTPTGEGGCSGNCAYNRYTLSVQLATPG